MNLSTIEMSRSDAEEALAEWAAAVRKQHTEEDEAIVEGYKLLAEGKSLISLSDTIRAGGEDDKLRPHMAVAPVASRTIFLTRYQSGSVRFTTKDRPGSYWNKEVSDVGVMVRNVFPSKTWQEMSEAGQRPCVWSAMVPVVPPRFRTRGWRGAHVLFEAEWAQHRPPAPVDPALIKHIRGDLWVVLGLWDLTPLERAVLLERNQETN